MLCPRSSPSDRRPPTELVHDVCGAGWWVEAESFPGICSKRVGAVPGALTRQCADAACTNAGENHSPGVLIRCPCSPPPRQGSAWERNRTSPMIGRHEPDVSCGPPQERSPVGLKVDSLIASPCSVGLSPTQPHESCSAAGTIAILSCRKTCTNPGNWILEGFCVAARVARVVCWALYRLHPSPSQLSCWSAPVDRIPYLSASNPPSEDAIMRSLAETK